MKELKKLIVYIVSVVLLLVTIDIVIGKLSNNYVRNNEIPGDYRSLDYLLKNFNNDVLILGSSVALNSLDPIALEDSLNVNTYNGASNGQTFSYQLILLKSVLSNHIPKMVFVGIKPDDLVSEGLGQRINILSPYYGMGYESIDSVLENQTKLSKVLMHSSLYRFNTIWFRILLYHFVEPGIKGKKGFIAKDVPTVFPEMDNIEMANTVMSEQRRRELTELVRICKDNDIKLFVFFPPQYVKSYENLHSTSLFKETEQLLKSNNMTLYDDTSVPLFMSDSTLFYDKSHLNINGAKKYTDYFIKRIKNE